MKFGIVVDLNSRIIDILKNPSAGRNMDPKCVTNKGSCTYSGNKTGVIVPPACLTGDEKLISISRKEEVETFLEQLGLDKREVEAVLANNVEQLPRY